MTSNEISKLHNELEEVKRRISTGAFISPKDLRREAEIESLLMTDGLTDRVVLRAGKPRKSHRVTSFTRDRR